MDSAEAPPGAEEARRCRGRAPAGRHESWYISTCFLWQIWIDVPTVEMRYFAMDLSGGEKGGFAAVSVARGGYR